MSHIYIWNWIFCLAKQKQLSLLPSKLKNRISHCPKSPGRPLNLIVVEKFHSSRNKNKQSCYELSIIPWLGFNVPFFFFICYAWELAFDEYTSICFQISDLMQVQSSSLPFFTLIFFNFRWMPSLCLQKKKNKTNSVVYKTWNVLSWSKAVP